MRLKMFRRGDQSDPTSKRALFAGAFLVRALLMSALFCSVTFADAILTYQETIVPTFLADFYGSGESANEFTSTEFNSVNNLPPMFSEIQITFTTTTSKLISGSGIVARTFNPDNLTV